MLDCSVGLVVSRLDGHNTVQKEGLDRLVVGRSRNDDCAIRYRLKALIEGLVESYALLPLQDGC